MDVAGHWTESVINKAIQSGGVAGYADELIRLNTITRSEFATILSRVTIMRP
ncbi:S-layer homology domain-containing protein [Paenibacillus lautus]|uniref:S-layer homology domain-containing protein n=1 Tax=Paenibacillus lautus TaxID=1401 RepID=UPI003D2C3984